MDRRAKRSCRQCTAGTDWHRSWHRCLGYRSGTGWYRRARRNRLHRKPGSCCLTGTWRRRSNRSGNSPRCRCTSHCRCRRVFPRRRSKRNCPLAHRSVHSDHGCSQSCRRIARTSRRRRKPGCRRCTKRRIGHLDIPGTGCGRTGHPGCSPRIRRQRRPVSRHRMPCMAPLQCHKRHWPVARHSRAERRSSRTHTFGRCTRSTRRQSMIPQRGSRRHCSRRRPDTDCPACKDGKRCSGTPVCWDRCSPRPSSSYRPRTAQCSTSPQPDMAAARRMSSSMRCRGCNRGQG